MSADCDQEGGDSFSYDPERGLLEGFLGKNRNIKGDRYSHLISQQDIGSYFTSFGAYRPRAKDPLHVHGLFWLVNVFFYSYAIINMILLVYTAFIDYTNQRLWVMFNATMVLKCAMLHIVLVRNAKQVVSFPKTAEYGTLCERAHPTAVKYFLIAFLIYFTIMTGWAIVQYNQAMWYLWLLISYSTVFGTFGYICFVATVMLFCVADTYLIHQKIGNLKLAAENQLLTKRQYLETVEFISSIKKETFRNNELILFSVLFNTISLGIVLFTYKAVTDDQTVLYTVWLFAYVTTILWVSDLAYLFSVLPPMSKSNDLATELRLLVAKDTWGDLSMEIQRLDVLQIMSVQPIQIKMFGMLLSRDEMRNRLLGLTLAVVSVTIKFIADIVRAY